MNIRKSQVALLDAKKRDKVIDYAWTVFCLEAVHIKCRTAAVGYARVHSCNEMKLAPEKLRNLNKDGG